MIHPVTCLVQYETPLKQWCVSTYDDHGNLLKINMVNGKAEAMRKAREGQAMHGYDIIEHDRSGSVLRKHRGMEHDVNV